MNFIYKKWDEFCKKLFEQNLISIPIFEIKDINRKYIVLKHDVETNVSRALEIAKIEYKYGHRGSFYVQAYLLNNKDNILMLNKIQNMGHEVSYHHDVMDSNSGNINNAYTEFEKNRLKFEKLGFNIKTVCQHGNPIIKRIGYSSNRDFFRNTTIQKKYPHIIDVMVDLKKKNRTEYKYYSDAGRIFKLIYDPINNDVINSDNKNIIYENLDEVFNEILNINNNAIISIHPHRWTFSSLEFKVKTLLFKLAKNTAKSLSRIAYFNTLMNKYYYLAKKI